MITLGLVGVGAWGKNYLKTISLFERIKVKYVCTRSQNSLQQLPNSTTKTTDYKELAKYHDIDGIIVATPASTHFKICEFFLNKGFNILVEKPMCLSFKEALTLKKLTKRKNQLMVAHLQLYNPAFIKVKDLLKKIGKIQTITFESRGSKKRDDISILWDWGPHHISMLEDLIGDLPKQFLINFKVKKDHSLIDNANITIKLSSIHVILKMGWGGKQKKRLLQVKGIKGKIIFDDSKSKKIKFVDSSSKVLYPSYSLNTPLFEMLTEFLKMIKNRKVPKTNIDNGVEVTRVLSQIEKSFE